VKDRPLQACFAIRDREIVVRCPSVARAGIIGKVVIATYISHLLSFVGGEDQQLHEVLHRGDVLLLVR